jgi:hypothetical protein
MGATVWPWGAVAGVVHFALIALAYGNRTVDRISAEAAVAKMKKIRRGVPLRVIAEYFRRGFERSRRRFERGGAERFLARRSLLLGGPRQPQGAHVALEARDVVIGALDERRNESAHVSEPCLELRGRGCPVRDFRGHHEQARTEHPRDARDRSSARRRLGAGGPVAERRE